jgi:hypothetical protein
VSALPDLPVAAHEHAPSPEHSTEDELTSSPPVVDAEQAATTARPTIPAAPPRNRDPPTVRSCCIESPRGARSTETRSGREDFVPDVALRSFSFFVRTWAIARNAAAYVSTHEKSRLRCSRACETLLQSRASSTARQWGAGPLAARSKARATGVRIVRPARGRLAAAACGLRDKGKSMGTILGQEQAGQGEAEGRRVGGEEGRAREQGRAAERGVRRSGLSPAWLACWRTNQVLLSKSAASCRSRSCSDGSPVVRLTMRPRFTAGLARMASAQRCTFL